jgi:hypothetical protein
MKFFWKESVYSTHISLPPPTSYVILKSINIIPYLQKYCYQECEAEQYSTHFFSEDEITALEDDCFLGHWGV